APVLVLGGTFTIAGDQAANRVAAFDPSDGSWSTFGSGTNDLVYALAVLANGDLVAGGQFTTAGGVAAPGVARWNGSSWSPLGSGIGGWVYALAAMPNGDLVAGGYFGQAGGTPVNNVARWNGSSWSALGAGISGTLNPRVDAFAVRANGELVVGGTFAQAGGTLANNIARWNGSSWSPLGTGTAGPLSQVAFAANGDVLVCGQFATAGGVPAANIARWNGTSWSGLAGGVPVSAGLAALAALPNGDIVAGNLDARRWNGTSWSQLGTTNGIVRTLAVLANGDILAAGGFRTIAGVDTPNLATWNGKAWNRIDTAPVPHYGGGVTTAPNGDVILAASESIGSNNHRVSRWTGSAWAPLGPVFDGQVASLVTLDNGDIIACGVFTSVGGVSAARIARWNGSAWLPMGSGMDDVVTRLLVVPGGLIAGGFFTTAGGVPAAHIAMWNGTTWSSLGAGLNGVVGALTIAANGDVVAGGFVDLLGPYAVARWNGVAWVGFGTMDAQVQNLVTLPNGDLVASGDFLFANGTPANRIARWDGATWQPLGQGLTTFPGFFAQATGLALLPDGDLVASGSFYFAGGMPAAGIARWDGVAWTALASTRSGYPFVLTPARDGSLLVTGSIARLDDAVSVGFVRLSSTCPASALPSTPGCGGSGGANVLEPTNWPWTGSTYRARASGLSASALALDIYGLSTLSLPLVAILPQGLLGCVLGVTPDVTLALVPFGGVVSTGLAIPDSPSLAGYTLFQQVVALELGAGSAITAVTSTNGLTLTIGML
ncbi:MAG TPA: hypothetical protein VFZ65_00110, partial [Planctomycetota bacterium]|nr:hypothetical protein [Planctomycetota bacterium]